jgi:DNA (cytosine-5)-methyltransferase 1
MNYPRLLEQAWQKHGASRELSAPTLVSLFAGAGGSCLGASMAGFRELLAVEWDEHAVACLRANFPRLAVHHGDIRGLRVFQALALAGLDQGELDLLEASPPCQGFSKAGRRLAHDPRNHLCQEFVRLLRGLQPKAFVMENVSAMAGGAQRPLFNGLLRDLARAGYRSRAWLLNAAHFLVPQNRPRLVIIGLREDLGFTPSPPPPTGWPLPLSAAIADFPEEQCPEKGHVWVDESPAGRNTKTWRLAAATPQGGVYAGYQRRLRWDLPAPTLTACAIQGRDRPPYLRRMHCHPLHTRTLSLAEYRRLASFPDAFAFPGPWYRGVSRIGNALPPLFMRAIAAHLRGLLQWRPAHA